LETYAAEISETLQKYGSCLLPGIGRLELVRLPAERSFQDNMLHPPAFTIVLTAPSAGDPQPSVIDQIALSKATAREQAEKEWQKTLQNIREKLSTGSSVPLEGLGWLNLGENGGISFVASFPSALFYPSVPLRPHHEPGQSLPEAQQPAEALESFSDTPGIKDTARESLDLKAQSRARWWIAGSIAILLLIGWFTYVGTKVRERKKDTLSEILNQKPADQGEKLDSMKQSIDSMRAAHKLANDSVRYKIIIASYDSKEKAEHQYRKLRGWGHPVELLTKDSSYELAWPFNSLPGDTTVNMVKMMNLYGKNIHIEYDNP
jgi:hypothetical protein